MLTGVELAYFAGFAINFIVAFIIVRGIYYPRRSVKSYLFTFLAFNVVIYFIMGLFTSVELSIGVGFGLFALFSILRYRTETVPIREMTYLFVMVALPIMNSILSGSGQFGRMIFINAAVIIVIWALEKGLGFRHGRESREVRYEKIQLIAPARRTEMIDDLKARTGLDVTGFEIEKIDFLKDTAKIRVFYNDRPEERK